MKMSYIELSVSVKDKNTEKIGTFDLGQKRVNIVGVFVIKGFQEKKIVHFISRWIKMHSKDLKFQGPLNFWNRKKIHMPVYIVSVQLKSLIELSMGRFDHVLNICPKKPSTLHHTINLFLRNNVN